MKKWISILCTVLLLCSAMSVAVSAATGTLEDPVICVDRDFNMVKIPAGETYYVSFTDTSGATKCQISVNSSTDKTAGYVVTCGETVLNNDENGYANLMATPDANGVYMLSITNNAAKQANFFIAFNEISPWVISGTPLYEGENSVTTEEYDTTLFVFDAETMGVFEVSTSDASANLSYWKGSPAYVTGMDKEAVNGKLEVTCESVGQSILIGLSGVDAANITITKVDDYTPPASIDYQEYQNIHTPINGFQLPDGDLTEVDITVPHTLVLDSDGIYHYGAVDGPFMYVDMTGVTFADLYECYYPASGGEVADRMRGTYLDAEGNTCGYDYLNAMHKYADALNSEGYYFLTIDIANYLQMYGKDQGWFNTEFSPFEEIKAGTFVEESAWLITSYYGIVSAEPENPENPETPAEPENPDEPTPDVPAEPETPDKPTTDVPAEPETPDKPTTDTPAEPETPDKPTTDTPAEPETPDKPTTDTPAEPETPDGPTTDTPAEPEAPNAPTTDAPVDEPDSPATGDASILGVMATLLLSATGALAFRKKRN